MKNIIFSTINHDDSLRYIESAFRLQAN